MMCAEHRNHFFTLLFITVAMVQCKAVFIKLLTTVNNLLTVVNSGRSMIKYEDLRVALMLFNPGEWLFTFDLKAGYRELRK